MSPEDNHEQPDTAAPESLLVEDAEELLEESAEIESPDSGWYVVRYRMLTTRLREKISQAPFEVFHPYKLARVPDARGQRKEVPVMSGYIFVHASYLETKEWARELGLYVMLNPFWEYTPNADDSSRQHEDPEAAQYLCIADKAMRPFMTAAELKACDLELFDPKVIDVHKDDLVEFISGELKGIRGYLKSGKGRNGGLVIVPLLPKQKMRSRHHRRHAHKAPLSYSYKAHKDEVAIVAFAPGNRHAKDCVLDAKPLVDSAFDSVCRDGTVDAATRERLLFFVRHYGRARLNTSIQAAHHYLLLYRIYAVLGLRNVGLELRGKIASQIVPDLLQRKKNAIKRSNTEAASKHQALLDELQATDNFFLPGQ